MNSFLRTFSSLIQKLLLFNYEYVSRFDSLQLAGLSVILVLRIIQNLKEVEVDEKVKSIVEVLGMEVSQLIQFLEEINLYVQNFEQIFKKVQSIKIFYQTSFPTI